MLCVWNRLVDKALPEIENQILYAVLFDGYNSKTGNINYIISKIAYINERWIYASNAHALSDYDLKNIVSWCRYEDLLKQAIEQSLVSNSKRQGISIDQMILEGKDFSFKKEAIYEPDGCELYYREGS